MFLSAPINLFTCYETIFEIDIVKNKLQEINEEHGEERMKEVRSQIFIAAKGIFLVIIFFILYCQFPFESILEVTGGLYTGVFGFTLPVNHIL